MFSIGRTRWHADSDKIRGLLFPRSTDMLDFLDRLVRRSRLFYRKEKLLPIVSFYRAWSDDSPMRGIEDRLRGQPRVVMSKVAELADQAPHADGAEDPDQRTLILAKIAPLRALLDHIVAEFSGDFPHVRRLCFPHYTLGSWLLFLAERGFEQHSEQNGTRQPDRIHKKLENALKNFIDQRYEIAQRSATLPNLTDDFPSWIKWLLTIVPPLGLFLMRIFWHAPKWFRKRQIGTIRPGSFTGLARRFAEWDASELTIDDISALLVDSFLEDLRRAYRRTSLLGAGRRRTTHAVLLLDPRNGRMVAADFLQLVSAQRNRRVQRGWSRRRESRWDPLLIITQGDDSTLERLGPIRRPADWPYGAANADYAYDRWLDKIDESGPAERSWLLPLRLPERPEEEPDGMRGDLFRTPRPTSVPVILPFVIIVTVLAGLIVGYRSLYNSCGALPWEPRMERTARADGTAECVGLILPSSSSRFYEDRVQTPDLDKNLANALIDVEEKIANLNDRIERENRQFSTIVYLGILTPINPDEYYGQLEQLRGLAVAQQQSMGDSLPIRVMLANAGDKLANQEVATRAIAQASEQPENRIVGVTGLGISLETTLDAASAIGNSKIPTLGNSLSATDLATRTTQYYHQVSPTNEREAAVISRYAKELLKADNALIYWSADDHDLYSKDLAEQARIYFRRAGIVTSGQRYKFSEESEGADIGKLGREACVVGDNGVVFYAGRADKLIALLDGMSSTCGGNYPKIVMGDEIVGFGIEENLARFPGASVDYVSFASSLAWGPKCDAAASEVRFYQIYREIFGDCSTADYGSSAISYDAALVFMEAIKRARIDNPNLPSGDLVLGKINEMRDRNSVSGASGRIGYSEDYGNGRIPVNKAVLILRAESGREDASVQFLCGQLDTESIVPDPLCPNDLEK